MTPLYNLGIGAYRLAAKAASLRSKKVSEMLRGQADSIAAVREAAAESGFDVWFHAASLGEFEQGRPIIDRLRREHPEKKILLTFFSPSGFNVRKSYPNVDCVAYLPFDTPSNAKAFIEAARPKMAVFIKYEFWGNYLETLSAFGIPTYIISAIFRPEQIFFKPWGGMFRKMLGFFTGIYVQDEASKQLLAGIGVKNVTVAGDTRFDRVTDVLAAAKRVDAAEALTADASMCLVAGSTWPPDEALLLPWLNEHPEVKAIIAPHEFNDERLRDIERALGPSATRLSEWSAGREARVLIVDSFGLLSSLYRYGNIAYVGGGFGAGIHNINEAAVYGVPVVFGPRHHKFKEASDLIGRGGAFDIKSANEGRKILDRLVADEEFRIKAGEAAGAYIRENIGASDTIYQCIMRN